MLRVGAIVGVVVAAAATLSAQREVRHVFVRVTDAQGTPVAGLGPTDFVLIDAGMVRDAVHVARAVAAVRVALLVDSSSIEAFSGLDAAAYLVDVRHALQAFLTALPPEYEVGFFTTGRQMRARVQPTTDRARLLRAAAEFSSDGAGNTLLNSIREVDERFMRLPPDRWPVWVVITADGPEMSRPPPPDDVWARIVNGILARGMTVHGVAVQYVGGTLTTEVALNLSKVTGGAYVPLVGSTGTLAQHLERIGARIREDERRMAEAYVLEYSSDRKLPYGDLEVHATRSGVRVAASLTRPF
jgi:hypothetical protein